MRKCILMLACFFVAVLFSHANAGTGSDTVVATIGERKVTLSDFQKVLGYFDAERQKMLETNPQLKETVLMQFVQSIVISDFAKQRGFDKNPDIREQLQFFLDNFLANEYLKREVAQKISVSDSDLKSYYESHNDEFRTPEMVRARHILVKADANSADERNRAREQAENYLQRIRSGEDFAKLAVDVSDDLGSRPKGGDLGFFPKGRMVQAFEEAAFGLKAGEVSELVETQFGFHIIKVEERMESTLEPFIAVKEQLMQKLLQDRTRKGISEFIDKAMRDAKTEIFPAALTGEKK